MRFGAFRQLISNPAAFRSQISQAFTASKKRI
jgi:hypothetical protein